MLLGLTINNFILVKNLHLEFSAGFNVLTGETGVGKSVLIESLNFVLGNESKKSLKPKKSPSEVSATFLVSFTHPLREFLSDQGIDCDEELNIRRILLISGRTRNLINASRCSQEVLKQIGYHLINIHGQHDSQQFIDTSRHRNLLDTFGNLQSKANQVQAVWSMLLNQRRNLKKQNEKIEKLAADRELTNYYLEELAQLDLQPNEVEKLETTRSVMKFASKNREVINQVDDLVGSDGGLGNISDAINALEKVTGEKVSSIELAIQSLERALIEIQDTENHLEEYKQKLNFDPNELDQLEDRLYEIRNLSRKHKVGPEQLFEFLEQLKQTQIDYSKDLELQGKLQKELTEIESDYDLVAKSLTKKRTIIAKKLDEEIQKEFKPLKLNKANFKTTLVDAQEGPMGREDIRFLVTTNPGFPLGPIEKIASGGELSRFLLALKICLTKEENAPTLIFDEIDTGVGGATADAVGKKLATLSKKTQVITITHSPQVASLGNLHYKIDKRVVKKNTSIIAKSLSERERVDEIARMLAAESITEEAKDAAKVLLGVK